jgi:MoxR-like ATPase
MANTFDDLSSLVKEEIFYIERIVTEVRKRIVGQDALIERMLVGLLTGGHILLEGVPGLAKTLAVKSLAEVIDVDFKRIQFTPDLLPADLLGTMVYNQKTGEFQPHKGPLFTHIVLADEINRAPAKVQSALLEAMQEKQITIGDTTFPLAEPFLVFATQNPIEQEGTYPLPEAQVDRFMLKALVRYPSASEEREILERMTGSPAGSVSVVSDGAIKLNKVLVRERLGRLRAMTSRIYIDDRIKGYILSIILATRNPQDAQLDVQTLIRFGASPRATIHLVMAAKALAFIRGRAYVLPEDVKAIGYDVLRHRILLTYEAEAENVTADDVLHRIFDAIKVP